MCNIHDCSPIWKPESKTLDCLGKVKYLNNQVGNGYDTFNSVMVDVKGYSIRLLASTSFSHDAHFISVSEQYAYENGQLQNPTCREAIEQYDKEGVSFIYK